VTTRADGFVRVWDTRGSREVLSVPQELSTEIALSPRGTRAAMTVGPEGNTQGEAGEGDTVRVFNLSADGEPQLLRHPRAVKQMFFGIDERTLVTVEAGNKGRTWNVDGRGREMTSFPHFGFIPPQLSRDGKYLLSRSDIEHVRVWDAMAGHPVTAALPVVPAGDPSAFAFSPDAKRFAFGTTKGNVSVVGLPGGQVIAEMSHAGEVSALAFSSDGKYLLSGSQDSTARILSIDDNREVARVSHPGPVRDVSFSAADGSRFLATASNEMARASLWRPADLRHEACRRVPSALPDGVWSPYLGSARPLGCVTVGQHVPH
jgi:WD40 repeat protein